MLPDKISRLAKDSIEAKLHPRPQLSEKIRSRAAQIKSSAGNPKARDAAATEIACAELERRSEIILEAYRNALVSVGLEPFDSLEADLEQAFTAHMLDEVIQIRDSIGPAAVEGGPPMVTAFVDLRWSPTKKMVAQMNLFCERLRNESARKDRSKTDELAPPVEFGKFTSTLVVDRAITKLRRRQAEVSSLTSKGTTYDSPEAQTAVVNFRRAILDIFGPNSPEYREYANHQIRGEETFMDMNDSHQLQQSFEAGIPRTLNILNGLVMRLEEDRIDSPRPPSSRTNVALQNRDLAQLQRTINDIKEINSKRTIGTHAAPRSVPAELSESLKKFEKDHPDPRAAAFVIMRFEDTKAHKEIMDVIRRELDKYGISALRADDKQYHTDLLGNILTYAHGCGFAIAVYERLERDDFNPNVAMEVGYVMALQKHLLLLKDRTLKQFHADLAGKLYRQFDPQNIPETLRPVLRQWLKDMALS